MEEVKELHATTQKSYYGKAIIIETDDKIYLQSYQTKVLYLDKKTKKIVKLWDGYSRTTQNHINDFLKLYGFDAINKKTWLNMQNDTNTNKQRYKIICTNGIVTYTEGVLFDDYDDAEQYADSKTNNFWTYYVSEV